VINLTNLLINCDLVIFDLDGTLIDSHQLISRTLVELTQEWDLATKPIDYYSHLIGLPLEKMWKTNGFLLAVRKSSFKNFEIV
jgi:phosphoglycolate phosphatase-like HAD superfamily hydrolase